ncbi:MAG: protein kinase [Clostridiaceae bacterium]
MLKPEETCMRCFAQLAKPKGVCPQCGCDNAAASNEAHQLECGSILAGTYLIGKVLGQGGFGITYIGWDLNLDIKVAIKEYYPEGCVTRDAHTHISVLTYAGPKEAYFQKGKERFVNEAKALAKFPGDSGVVGVRTFFYENGTAYIVMDFVEGETLKAYAQRRGGKLPAAEVLSLFQPIFRSLARVHDSGLLHRDISPDNLMLKTDGMLALLDFGAARQISAEGEHSNTINVKHGFAPEEQYRTRGEQGPWTDVYALCATIYRLTTGRTPPEALDRMADGTLLTPPNQLGADFTPAQEAAILHGLAVRASDRTRDVRQLEKELYGGERTVFATSPLSVSYEPAAPQSSFITQPLTRSEEPAASSAPRSSFVTQPQSSYVTQPQPASVAPVKDSGAFAGNTPDAAPLDDAERQEEKRKKGKKARTIATSIAFAVLLIMTLFAFTGIGGFLLIGLLILDAIGLFWLLLHKGVLKNVDHSGKIEKAASLITLSGGALSLALILAGVIAALSAPSGPASAQAATEPPASAEQPAATLDPTIVIDWQDPTIEAGIRSAIGKSEGEAITTGDVAYIYSLKIAGDTLYINDDSVWPYVNTYDNTYSVDNGQTSLPISDQTISLADLVNFGGLTVLNVYAVNVSGLESLNDCISLNTVWLDACGNVDLNEFSSCDQLYELSISDCDEVVLTGAGEKLFIGSLSLSNCGTVDAGELAQFTNLSSLSIWAAPLSSAEQIGSMTNLTSLAMGYNGVSNLDFLRNLANLSSLSLSGEEITELPSLDALTELTLLHLTFCTLDDSDLQQIASHTALTELMLDGCPFSDLSFVENLANLVVISFDSSEVRDITPLKNLTKLETLWLMYIDVNDISALKNCKSLKRVYIVSTRVSNYSPLEGLPIEYISVDAAYTDQVRSILPNAIVDSW